uniref:Uncharacterized protein n=1 Tax=Leptobrachium leishanense TaxID=445787 RepID=A0A8C5MNZ5_9ANUR
MTAQRRSGYENILTATHNLTIKYAGPSAGPAVLLHKMLTTHNPPPPDMDDDSHDCVAQLQQDTTPRGDLQPTPLEDGEIVFVDGSCSRPSDGLFLTGFAIVQLPDKVLMAHSIPFVSAQAAELIALTQACRLFIGKDVTIYTDSRYAFGVVHDFGQIWKQRGFVTVDGKGISHADLVKDLLSAIMLPERIAIVKCQAHTNASDPVSRGNALADAVAKQAAAAGTPHPDYDTQLAVQRLMVMIPQLCQDQDIANLQAMASEADLKFWEMKGLTKDINDLWSDKEGKVGITKAVAPLFILHFHGFGHIGKEQTAKALAARFVCEDLNKMVEDQISRCLSCIRNNPAGKTYGKHEHLPPPEGPMQQLQIDFTHMPKAKGGVKYLLVIVDQFSKWVEGFGTTKENAATVGKILCKEIIPRFGCPLQINSDKGTPFTSQVTQKICELLCIDWKFHIPYHPQSSRQVERANRTIKDKIRKGTNGTFKNWPDYLPAVLAEIRMTPNKTTGFSPFEVLMGRPFPTPWAKIGPHIIADDICVAQAEYVVHLIGKLNGIYGDVSLSLPLPAGDPTHPFKPGDQVVVKQIIRRNKEDFPYSEPTTVIAVTRTAVLTESSPAWIHASRIKIAYKNRMDHTQAEASKEAQSGPVIGRQGFPPTQVTQKNLENLTINKKE